MDKKDKNFEFFRKHLKDYLANTVLKGKFVVIADGDLKGAYDTFEAAIKFAATTFPHNEFIVQQVIADEEQINFVRAAV